MKRILLIMAITLSATMASADNITHILSNGPFTQDWSNPGLITVDDDWSTVPSIQGFRGDGLASTGTDPQTVVANDVTAVIDVNANELNPSTFGTGGLAEFDGISDPVVAFQGSGTADAPYMVIYLNSQNQQDIRVQYSLRDIDAGAVDAIQQVALQYRTVFNSDWTNVPGGYVADASTGPNLANAVTNIDVILPVAANNQGNLQIRIITTNAAGSDEFIGVDNINISSSPLGGAVTASISSSTDVTINGGSDGSATAAGSGGTPPYSFLWSNGATTATASSLAAGTYTVTVTDFVTSDSTSVTINEPTPVVATATVDNHVSVNGGNDGQATVVASGGNPGYTYAWSNGQINATAVNLFAATYTVTVTDSSGATGIDSVTITEPSAVVVTATVDNHVTVNGGNDGQATASASGGNPGYTYLWSDGQTTATASNLMAGTYSVTATDSTGGTDVDSLTITEPTPVVATATVDNHVTINGGSDGQATVVASGGNPGYTYAWSNGQINATAVNLFAGTYTVTVTDSSGATGIDSVTITEPSAVVVTATVDNHVTVNGGNDGQATASASGGNPGYTYLWSDGQTTATASNLMAGTYSVTATDSSGGTGVDSVTITEPGAVVVAATVDNHVTVNGGNDGQATASASGGNPGYTYLWSDGQTTATASNLMAGTYSVTATDSSGGTGVDSVTITEPGAVVVAATVDNHVTVNGGNDGQATASASGGNPGYTYLWSDGQTTATASNLMAGTYSVTATDSSGGTGVDSVTITEPTALMATITTVVNESEPGAADGSASVTASGGVTPYSYLWSTGETTSTINNLTAGTYTVTVTDNNGATSSPGPVVIVTGSSTAVPVPTNAIWALVLLALLMLLLVNKRGRFTH